MQKQAAVTIRLEYYNRSTRLNSTSSIPNSIHSDKSSFNNKKQHIDKKFLKINKKNNYIYIK